MPRQDRAMWLWLRFLQAIRPRDEDDTGPGHIGPEPPEHRHHWLRGGLRDREDDSG